MTQQKVYGLVAQWDDAAELLAAAKKAHGAGYRRMEAYTPMPVEGLSEAIGFHRTYVSLMVLVGGIFGGFLGFYMQWYANVADYPWNIGGRPPNSWVAFIPITFELTVLCAGLTACFGMLALNGLPKPYHPLFNVPEFELASRTHFFLCIEARDPRFDLEKTGEFLLSLKPQMMAEVPYKVLPSQEAEEQDVD